jgi:transcriptional regulator with XRE-family HTH domain
MNHNKRIHLKRSVKLNLLASRCDISPMTLSRIINNHIKPSDDLARRLAETANQLCFSEDYFKAEDFIPRHLRK